MAAVAHSLGSMMPFLCQPHLSLALFSEPKGALHFDYKEPEFCFVTHVKVY